MPELGEVRIRRNKYGKQEEWIYSYNPAKQVTRWHSVANFIKYGYQLDVENYIGEDAGKGRALRENIVDVLQTKLSENYNYQLVDDVKRILNRTNDEDLAEFADDNSHLLSTYFRYEESNLSSSDMDGRLFVLIEKIGKELGNTTIDPYSKKYASESNTGKNMNKVNKAKKAYVKLANLEKVNLDKE